MSFKDSLKKALSVKDVLEEQRVVREMYGSDLARSRMREVAKKGGLKTTIGDLNSIEGMARIFAASQPGKEVVTGLVATPSQQATMLFNENDFVPQHVFYPLSFDANLAPFSLRPTHRVGIAIDASSNRICLIRHETPIVHTTFYNAMDLLEVELSEDDETLSKSKGGSVVGRAVVGGLLTGGVGAIIGGVTAKRKSETNVTSLKLKLIVNDSSTPSWEVNFLPPSTSFSKSHVIYKNASEQGNRYYALIKILLDTKANRQESAKAAAGPVPNMNQTPLQALQHKLVAGEITEEEFTRKKNLLGG